MLVSSEDHRKCDDRGNVNKKYRVHRSNHVSMEGIRVHWKESGFVERNQALLEGIRFCQLCGKYGMMMV
jgi:hypothetical protein